MQVIFDYEKLKKQDSALYRRMLYEVATLFISGKTHIEIVKNINEWAKKNAKNYYNEHAQKDNINTVWVGRRIADARDQGFLTLGRFEENEIVKAVRSSLPTAEGINLVVAPDFDALLRQVWIDFDEFLSEKVKYTKISDEIILATSGGSTMLALAKAAPSVKGLLRWYKPGEIPQERKDKVTIFSLTSGGIRTDIAALSDTVAANLAQELGVKARGLMGPALFQDRSARDDFIHYPEVHDHIDLVKKADVILTSVGYVDDEEALTNKVLSSIDPKYIKRLCRKYSHLADILYNCYDGFTGETIPFPPKIRDRIFSVVGCKELREMVNRGHTRCIVVARGYEKGYHTLRGVIVRKMASDIYMDFECAKGLIKAASEFE